MFRHAVYSTSVIKLIKPGLWPTTSLPHLPLPLIPSISPSVSCLCLCPRLSPLTLLSIDQTVKVSAAAGTTPICPFTSSLLLRPVGKQAECLSFFYSSTKRRAIAVTSHEELTVFMERCCLGEVRVVRVCLRVHGLEVAMVTLNHFPTACGAQHQGRNN